MDVSPLIGILAFCAVVFALCHMLIVSETSRADGGAEVPSDYATPQMATYTSANMLLFGSFTATHYEPSGNYLSVANTSLFLIAALSGPLILLNMAIALMGDSWERVQANTIARGLKGRGKLLIEMQLIMLRKLAAYFPAWLHVLRRSEGRQRADDDMWTGRVTELRRGARADKDEVLTEMKAAKKAAKAVKGDVQAVKSEMKSEMKSEISTVKSEISELKAMIKDLSDRIPSQSSTRRLSLSRGTKEVTA